MVLGDAASKLERFVWILNYVFKSIAWSLFNIKPSNLGRSPIYYLSGGGVNIIYRLVKI